MVSFHRVAASSYRGCQLLRAPCPSFRYTQTMQLTLDLPDELSAALAASGQDPSRAALEAIALEAYRQGKVSAGQLKQFLGYHTRMQVHALLKEHGVYLHYALEDLEHDRKAGDALPPQPT